jgi:hypothetical protein
MTISIYILFQILMAYDILLLPLFIHFFYSKHELDVLDILIFNT